MAEDKEKKQEEEKRDDLEKKVLDLSDPSPENLPGPEKGSPEDNDSQKELEELGREAARKALKEEAEGDDEQENGEEPNLYNKRVKEINNILEGKGSDHEGDDLRQWVKPIKEELRRKVGHKGEKLIEDIAKNPKRRDSRNYSDVKNWIEDIFAYYERSAGEKMDKNTKNNNIRKLARRRVDRINKMFQNEKK